ncbi:MAG: TldD protein [Thermoleophilaceae bacterium]|jgi:TldD protein|nr:TldD protein [Thermoleophilaceae bacterium]
MRDLLASLMDSAAANGAYADARFVRSRDEHIATRNGEVDGMHRDESEGLGVRVRVGGAWGFAATRRADRASAEIALARALAIARAQPAAEPTPLAPEPPARGEHVGGAGTNPFEVPLERKLERLLAADAALGDDKRLMLRQAHFVGYSTETVFASTEGAQYEQTRIECGGGLSATAADGEELQTRSFPGSHEGNTRQAGYEHFDATPLVEEAPRVAEEAVALLTAPDCPPGSTTLILDGEQLALQVHESVGHAVELDRILGSEASYAGISWVRAEDLDSLQYGSLLMNVTADATNEGGLGSYQWDDEGVEGRAVPIVREGILRGFLSGRESAASIGLERSAGCMRAEGFARQPIVRMSNVNLEPGDAGSLEDLIADTDSGIFMSTNRSWSIDQLRLHFQFGTEIAWEIEGGKLGRMLRNPTYAGITPQFWRSMDAVCSRPAWQLWGVTNCGKGEPGQAMHVSHGAAPARFREIQVGIA